MLAVDRAAAGVVVTVAKRAEFAMPNRTSFRFHVAAGMQCASILVHAGQQWIPARFSPIRGRHSDEK